MVHITITSFHINLYANKSYAIDVDTPPSRVLSRTPKFKILENTLNRRHMPLNGLQRGLRTYGATLKRSLNSRNETQYRPSAVYDQEVLGQWH